MPLDGLYDEYKSEMARNRLIKLPTFFKTILMLITNRTPNNEKKKFN